MKILDWIKSLSWIAIAGAIGTAAVMIYNAKRAGKLEVEVKHDEAKVALLNNGSQIDIQAAAQLQGGITTKKKLAREVRKKTEKGLERLGEDEMLADIATRFNNKRVRSRKDAAA